MKTIALALLTAASLFAQAPDATIIGTKQIGCLGNAAGQVLVTLPRTGAPGWSRVICARLDGAFVIDTTTAPPTLRVVISPALLPIFVDNETPTGTANGTNPTFTLANAPNPATSLKVFRNGILQKVGLDFNLLGPTITFLPTSLPETGDLLTAWYRR